MADRTELAFRRAARRLIAPGDTVLAAVSGGGDSVALLHLLSRFARTGRQPITVAHLDHALRRGSAADRRFVERLARDLGHPCVAERRDVAGSRRRSESPEEAARRVRRAFLLETAQRSGCTRIATGHTLDDQAETILMRLARGAGATALTGMAESGPGPFVRPLLGLERADLRDYLDRHGLAHRDDPSNRDLRFDRNRVRRLVVPVFASALNPRAARHVVRAARRIREDAEYLDALADSKLRDCTRRSARGRLVIDAAPLASLTPVLGRRVARLALLEAGADPRRVGSRHVEALLDLAHGGRGRAADLPGGLTALRRGPRLVLERRGDAAPSPTTAKTPE
jgi:tRNA(Ile)-lysidine synthase